MKKALTMFLAVLMIAALACNVGALELETVETAVEQESAPIFGGGYFGE